ncbi:MAG: hypothetical protein K2N25_05740 [Muribaculaceae bacterium]|nr:hypothetical protein [Muribaculaceae bacterium]
MEQLKGKSILIGKEPKNGRLLLYIPEIKKVGAIGTPNSVPGCVSRCQADKGLAHTRLSIDKDGNLTLTNLKPENHTYVNGLEIMSRRITPSTKVELGIDRYPLDIQAILDAAKKLLPPSPLDISHLEKIYNDYEAELDRITMAQQDLAKKRMLPIMVSSSSGVITAISGVISLNALWVTAPIAGIVSLMYFKNYRKKDTSYEERKAAQSEFQHKYVCPNCNHFFGGLSFDILTNQLTSAKDKKMYCPKCGRELIVEK